MLTPQDLTVDDFSGGITDFYIGAAKNRAQQMDNFLILNNKKLKSRPGSVVDYTGTGQDKIPPGNQRIGGLINYYNSDTLFVQSARNLYYRNPSTHAWQTLTGPNGGHPVLSAGDTSNFASWSEWNRHLLITNDAWSKPQKVYKDGSGTFQVRTAGLPALASTPTVTAGGAGGRVYLYAFHYSYTYTVGSQTFLDAGPVTELELTASLEPSTSNNSITGIPVLSNGTTDNYDTSNIKVTIFRSIDGGDQLFKIGEVTNGVTTFTDNVSDATCQTGEAIYTTGGVKDNDPPPLCRYVHTCNGFTYWAGLQNEPGKYRQAIQDDPDSVPQDFEDEIDEDLQGFSSAAGVPIAFGYKKVYRVEGKLDEFGQGFLDHVVISDDAGCVSHWSIVQAEQKVFWAGNDGFYVSDGYQVTKISFHLKNSYKAYKALISNTKKIQGTFHIDERRIYWTFQTLGSSTDLDACIILDLEYGITNESTFTTMSGKSFSPSAITYFNKKLYRGHKSGYVMIHDDTYTTDPAVNTAAAAADWGTETIIWNYKGPGFNFGTDLIRKWVPRISFKGKNESNVSIQINGIVDDGKKTKATKEIRFRDNFIWGDSEFVWNNTSCKWGGVGVIDQWRRLPAGSLRCSLFQVQITNAYTVVTNSDTLGSATFDGAANTVVLPTSKWPTASIGYDLYTEVDNYTKPYPVTGRTDDTLTVTDAQGTLPTGSLKWLLKGYRKDEILHMLSHTIVWAPLSMSTPTYDGTGTGVNS